MFQQQEEQEQSLFKDLRHEDRGVLVGGEEEEEEEQELTAFHDLAASELLAVVWGSWWKPQTFFFWQAETLYVQVDIEIYFLHNNKTQKFLSNFFFFARSERRSLFTPHVLVQHVHLKKKGGGLNTMFAWFFKISGRLLSFKNKL